jgi:quercetin dioxygenase-like cupin family protein
MHCSRLTAAAFATFLVFSTQLSAQATPGAIPGRCAEAPTRSSDAGCYLIANRPIERLPDEPVFWHIHSYLTRAAAEAARSDSSSAVAESFGKVWLLTIAGARWEPVGGERVAKIGPLPTTGAKRYTARYMEATFPPNLSLNTSVHRHSGPEAWYVVTGAQCLRTPTHTTVLKAGEGGIVPAGPPMVLIATGRETRRALFLVLHDASEPWMSNTTDWAPTRDCP